MFIYCKRCGLIKKQKFDDETCPACETLMDIVPSEYLTSTGFMFSSQSARKEFENAIKASDDFDENAYEQNNHKAIKCAEVLIPKKIPYLYILGAFPAHSGQPHFWAPVRE